jgi:flagellar motor protein MotB
MITMDNSLMNRVKDGTIEAKEAYMKAANKAPSPRCSSPATSRHEQIPQKRDQRRDDQKQTEGEKPQDDPAEFAVQQRPGEDRHHQQARDEHAGAGERHRKPHELRAPPHHIELGFEVVAVVARRLPHLSGQLRVRSTIRAMRLVSEIIMAPMPDSRITGVMESWMIGSSEPAGEASMGGAKSAAGRPATSVWRPGEDCPPRRRLTRGKDCR